MIFSLFISIKKSWKDAEFLSHIRSNKDKFAIPQHCKFCMKLDIWGLCVSHQRCIWCSMYVWSPQNEVDSSLFLGMSVWCFAYCRACIWNAQYAPHHLQVLNPQGQCEPPFIEQGKFLAETLSPKWGTSPKNESNKSLHWAQGISLLCYQ